MPSQSARQRTEGSSRLSVLEHPPFLQASTPAKKVAASQPARGRSAVQRRQGTSRPPARRRCSRERGSAGVLPSGRTRAQNSRPEPTIRGQSPGPGSPPESAGGADRTRTAPPRTDRARTAWQKTCGRIGDMRRLRKRDERRLLAERSEYRSEEKDGQRKGKAMPTDEFSLTEASYSGKVSRLFFWRNHA